MLLSMRNIAPLRIGLIKGGEVLCWTALLLTVTHQVAA